MIYLLCMFQGIAEFFSIHLLLLSDPKKIKRNSSDSMNFSYETLAYCHSSLSIIIIVQHKRIQINWNPTHLCGFVFERPGEIWRKEKKVFNEDSLLFDKVGKIGCVYAIQV